jgi:hypothetical protein
MLFFVIFYNNFKYKPTFRCFRDTVSVLCRLRQTATAVSSQIRPWPQGYMSRADLLRDKNYNEMDPREITCRSEE